jgi:hypothetical protein
MAQRGGCPEIGDYRKPIVAVSTNMRKFIGFIFLIGMSALAAPETAREHEILENYPLDSLQLAGTLSGGEELFGLIRTPDQLVHRVKVGSYIGEHQGRVTAIAKDRVTIVEPANEPDGVSERKIELKAGPTQPTKVATLETLATDCEKEIRAHAVVTEIVSRGSTRDSVNRYQVVFRGQPGSTVKANCIRGNEKPLVSYAEIEQDGHPHWGAEGRSKLSPVGASPCDSKAEVEAFNELLHSDDSKRLIARRVSRLNEVLTLQLDGGKQIQLKDELRGCDEGTPDCTRYRFLEWRSKEHAYLVYVLDYENTYFLVIDAQGKRSSLSGYPIWSPSGRWFALSAGESGGFDNVSFLVQDARVPSDKPAFLENFGSGSFCVASWLSDRALAVQTVQNGKPGELYTYVTRRLEYDGANWHWSDARPGER